MTISTHTPVKGVTVLSYYIVFLNMISTHTPVKGVTNEANQRHT